MSMHVSHLSVVGEQRGSRETAVRRSGPWDVAVNCHRRLRGPYSGLGEVLRILVPEAYHQLPEVVADKRVAILCVAPDLAAAIGSAPMTLTQQARDQERTRWYSPLRTRRISNDILQLLIALAQASPAGTLSLFFDTVHEADHTDREFLAIALRRLDPRIVRLAVGHAAGCVFGDLATQLETRTEAVICDAPPETADDETGAPTADELALRARAFVDGDGVGDEPAELAAYQELDPELRARYHDRRAAELEAAGAFGPTLGALPYHRRKGAERAEKAWPTVMRAEQYCMDVGLYHAALELQDAMAALLEELPVEDPDEAEYYIAIHRGQVLGVLDRQDEAHAAYIRALGHATHPEQVMILHYNLGMLYTRHNRPEDKDHLLAKAHLNTSVAIASRLDDPADQAFYTVFMGNGLALADVHLGDLAGALRLVDEGLGRLDCELEQSKHLLHRSVLRHNRAQVLSALGHADKAMADLDALVEIDPYHQEYHFDRGNARRTAGDLEGALADYDRALALGVPFPELFHNRGDLLAARGDTAAAIGEFRQALEREPDELESRIALAALLLEEGQADAARAVVRDGLSQHGENARLLCLLAEVELAGEDLRAAHDALERALAADPDLHQGYAIRASLRYGQERFADAVDDLDRALALAGDDPDLLFNRGYAYEAQGRVGEAIEDYTRALDLPGADREELLERREHCLAAAAAAAKAASTVAFTAASKTHGAEAAEAVR